MIDPKDCKSLACIAADVCNTYHPEFKDDPVLKDCADCCILCKKFRTSCFKGFEYDGFTSNIKVLMFMRKYGTADS